MIEQAPIALLISGAASFEEDGRTDGGGKRYRLLLSPLAGFITGANLMIDGGYTAV
ncbi:hypothetical protein C4K18_3039 [Pseudomonas chlororaphis subsp. aurantiaca]|nr:hypothetical protein C4K18_3039 [Pseudomonas chlororaphis subsp. aurantiaca]